MSHSICTKVQMEKQPHDIDGNLKYEYRNREFWCRGYYIDTVGKNEKKIVTYIQEQPKEDELSEQLTLNLEGQFTGRGKTVCK